ncbi:MAG: hypothetical protein NVS2B12_40950 [Ktedonobacteraceae bacterium]
MAIYTKRNNDIQQQPVTNYGYYPEPPVGRPTSYQQGYTTHSETPPSSYSDGGPDDFAQQGWQAAPDIHYAAPAHHMGSAPGAAFNVVRVSTKNTSALIIEIVLSLFGLFGIGWLLAGETTIGVILLLGSIFIYWPIIILGTIFTFGLGLICLGPLVIGAIILNLLLLNTVLDRHATQYIISPQQMYTNMPPQQ